MVDRSLAVVGRAGVVEDRGEDRQRAVPVVRHLDEPRLLRVVDVRGGVDLPEAAGAVGACVRGDRVDVGVAVDPGDHALLAEQVAVTSSPSTRGELSPPVADERVVHRRAGVVGEDDHRLALRGRDGRLQPGELRLVERAVGVPVGVDGVHHDEPEAALVEGVVRRVGVAVGRVKPWPLGQPGGAEVLVDDLAAARARAASGRRSPAWRTARR